MKIDSLSFWRCYTKEAAPRKECTVLAKANYVYATFLNHDIWKYILLRINVHFIRWLKMVTTENGRASVTLPILSNDCCMSFTCSFNKKVRQFKSISNIAILMIVKLCRNRLKIKLFERPHKNPWNVYILKMIFFFHVLLRRSLTTHLKYIFR